MRSCLEAGSRGFLRFTTAFPDCGPGTSSRIALRPPSCRPLTVPPAACAAPHGCGRRSKGRGDAVPRLWNGRRERSWPTWPRRRPSWRHCTYPAAHDLRRDYLGARGVRCGRAVTCIVAAVRAWTPRSGNRRDLRQARRKLGRAWQRPSAAREGHLTVRFRERLDVVQLGTDRILAIVDHHVLGDTVVEEAHAQFVIRLLGAGVDREKGQPDAPAGALKQRAARRSRRIGGNLPPDHCRDLYRVLVGSTVEYQA